MRTRGHITANTIIEVDELDKTLDALDKTMDEHRQSLAKEEL